MVKVMRVDREDVRRKEKNEEAVVLDMASRCQSVG